jgi:cyclic beta-1,2-glucan synthetase
MRRPHRVAGRLAAGADALADAVGSLADGHEEASRSDLLFWAHAAGAALAGWQREVRLSPQARAALDATLAALAAEAREMALAMQFGFLLDQRRRLLSIGCRADDGTLDPSCYDLLASEARLASFFAIAKNDVPVKHWFRLGRAVTPVGHGAALISWSGSMFEYLMPSLVMRAPAGSLLEQTSRLVVRRQIAYGAAHERPVGRLGIRVQRARPGDDLPVLELRRARPRTQARPGENLVIAPYATGLAAMVDPEAAARQFRGTGGGGALGRHGFYEALDYTRSRLQDGASAWPSCARTWRITRA